MITVQSVAAVPATAPACHWCGRSVEGFDVVLIGFPTGRIGLHPRCAQTFARDVELAAGDCLVPEAYSGTDPA